MSVPFTHITQSVELDERDVAAAVVARDATRALLVRLATVAAPETGVAKVLLVFARMATTACDWIDGDLCIELVSDDDMTLVETATELGGGLRERIFPPLPFRAPLSEFARAIDSAPAMIAPLAVRAKSEQRITLSATADVRRTTIPPPPIEISRDSLFTRAPAAFAPGDSNDGPALPLVNHVPAEAAARFEPPERSEPSLGDVDAAWED